MRYVIADVVPLTFYQHWRISVCVWQLKVVKVRLDAPRPLNLWHRRAGVLFGDRKIDVHFMHKNAITKLGNIACVRFISKHHWGPIRS